MSEFTLNTKISVAEPYGKGKLGNLTFEDAKFWGAPNFSGDPERDKFKDPRRKFTIQVPNELADQLRALGWNVKTTQPTPEEVAQGREPISSLKVMVGKNPDIFVIRGEDSQKLRVEAGAEGPSTVGMLDRARIDKMDLEIRAWEYDPDEKPGDYSARLVQLVAVITPNILGDKYAHLLQG